MSLLFSNIILFQNSSMLVYCYYFHAILGYGLIISQLRKCLETTMYNVMYMKIVTLVSVSPGSSSLLPSLVLVTVLLVSLSWVSWLHHHVTFCGCALLLFRHNAHMLLACNNFSHIIILTIIDSSLASHSFHFRYLHWSNHRRQLMIIWMACNCWYWSIVCGPHSIPF